MIGAFCANVRIPMCDLLMTMLLAWSAPIDTKIFTAFPHGSGIFGGGSSLTPPQKSL